MKRLEAYTSSPKTAYWELESTDVYELEAFRLNPGDQILAKYSPAGGWIPMRTRKMSPTRDTCLEQEIRLIELDMWKFIRGVSDRVAAKINGGQMAAGTPQRPQKLSDLPSTLPIIETSLVPVGEANYVVYPDEYVLVGIDKARPEPKKSVSQSERLAKVNKYVRISDVNGIVDAIEAGPQPIVELIATVSSVKPAISGLNSIAAMAGFNSKRTAHPVI